eukprot:NODE_16886_length_972_cov_10.289941.p1 GENE.NODE_16886_length_972_cov_10.289941~~NODE_16886_length_972_cov_10.289941.p1  ORF type:complete len:196 (-),score=35.25 NODE_16886_length_972_cov_10.289941:225-812(-)
MKLACCCTPEIDAQQWVESEPYLPKPIAAQQRADAAPYLAKPIDAQQWADAEPYLAKPEQKVEPVEVSTEPVVPAAAPEVECDAVSLSSASCKRASSQLNEDVQASFYVEVAKSNATQQLGVEIMAKADTPWFVVREIYPGLIQMWNEEHPDAEVHSNDRVVEANGVTGDAKAMLQRIAHDQKIQLKVVRGAPLS